nr:uncharacterized protein LOC110070780 isoform X2 [Pogona vitticeps]
MSDLKHNCNLSSDYDEENEETEYHHNLDGYIPLSKAEEQTPLSPIPNERLLSKSLPDLKQDEDIPLSEAKHQTSSAFIQNESLLRESLYQLKQELSWSRDEGISLYESGQQTPVHIGNRSHNQEDVFDSEPGGVLEYHHNLDGYIPLSKAEEQTPLSPIPNERLLSKSLPDLKQDEDIPLSEAEDQTPSAPIRNESLLRKPPFRQLKKVWTKKLPAGNVVLLILILCIIFTVIYQNKKPSGGDVPLPHHSPPCPPRWIWYQGNCYYFSKEERNWSSSQDFCSSHHASLARITNEENDFIHLLKGRDPFWIGLRRFPGQPWTWLNGDIAT